MNNLFPLRTIVGSSIPVKRIIPIQIGGRRTIKIETRIHENLEKTVYDWIENDNRSDTERNYFNIYLKYLPDIIENGTVYNPMLGMPTLPGINSNVDSLSDFISTFLNNDSYKNPSDLPFPASDSVASLYGYQDDNFIELKKTDLYSNRDKVYSFLIELEKEVLIGGICFQGYPYIPSRIENTPEGMTVGNFGLPREIRLTPLPSVDKTSSEQPVGFHRSQFIDSEYAYTRQEIISHSGLNYLTIDPVKTNLFLLTITDLPFIPKVIDLDAIPENADRLDDSLLIKGFKGFAIPYLYFFEYKESTKRDARLHAGLMGVKSNATFSSTEDTSESRLRKAFPEYEFNYEINGTNRGVYMLFTAHSALGQQRIFDIYNRPSIGVFGDKNDLKECYVSDVLEANENVTLFLQQGEEYERCIAGLKALFLLLPDDDETEKFAEKFANYSGVGIDDNELSVEERTFIEGFIANLFHLPEKINFCERIGIKVYEIDSLAGMSPASIELNSKYATLLADIAIDDFSDVIFSQFLKGIPFKRVSSSKYLAIELTNLGEESGQIAIHSLQMIRSAHVSVQPRPAKNQTIKAMHYRLIGAELADDFSALGNEGFNFSIDHQVAGQSKDIIYSANSLLDLLHTGGARIHSNVRRRAVEEEISNAVGGITDNYDERKSSARMSGWRRSETGEGVLNGGWHGANRPSEFESYSSAEMRTHNETLSPQEDVPEWKANAIIGNAMYYPFEPIESINNQIPSGKTMKEFLDSLSSDGVLDQFLLGSNQILIPTYNEVLLYNGFEKIWKGIDTGHNHNALKVRGMKTVNSSPFGLNTAGKNILQALEGLRNNNGFQIAENIGDILTGATALVGGINIYGIAAMNSLGMGLMLTVGGLGVTFSTSSGGLILPSFTYTNSFGTQGNIIKQANKTGYAYSQYLNNSFDEGSTESKTIESKSRRIVTRKEVPKRDNERIRGSEVMWQGKIQDIVTGSVPLNITLPATATKMNYGTADNTIQVRFNSGFSSSVEVDFWFEIIEEGITDDF